MKTFVSVTVTEGIKYDKFMPCICATINKNNKDK